MTSLARLQSNFRNHLVSDDRAVEADVTPQGRRGLAVYRYAYGQSLRACLRETFEITHAWIGDDAFEEAAADHIQATPPASWTLAEYGEGFDRTLGARHPGDPEISELAWLDWTLRRAFDGPDAALLDPASLASIDWEHARLRLAPTFAMRSAATNAVAIRSALAAGDTPPPARSLDRPSAITVWRQGLSPRYLTVGEIEHRALLQAADGATFGDICRQIAADMPEADQAMTTAGGLLGRWIADGVLVGATA